MSTGMILNSCRNPLRVYGVICVGVALLRCVDVAAATLLVMNPGYVSEDANVEGRAAFAERIAKVRRGMSEAEARSILGEPDDVRTAGEPAVPDHAKSSLAYGTIRHQGLGTLGEVIIGDDGRVLFINGGTGVPPAAGLGDEKRLR